MRARAELTIGPGGRLVRMVTAPPVAFRSAGDAVYLVGTAAGPLGDDDISVHVEVAAGASLRLRSAAATIVYTGTASAQRFEVGVGAGADLDWHPEALILTAGCHHRQHSRLRVAAGAVVDWTEEVVFGRHDEGPGAADLRLDVDVEGEPLLRHQVVIGAPGWDGPAGIGGWRTAGLRLVIGPLLAPPAQDHGEGWAWANLEGPGRLLLALADDLAQLRERMACAAR